MRRPRGVRPLLLSVTLAFAACLALACFAGRGSWRTSSTDACAPFDHAYDAYTRLLAAHVTDGIVDYTRMKGEGRALLDESVRAFEAACASDYDAWSVDERLAFWVNAYNLYTIALVVDHMPVASIQDIGAVKHTVWFKTATRETALHGALSLDTIEHGILRKDFAEPRIHFAIVCASFSCPKLAPAPYVGAQLDAQLDDAARGFVRDATKNRYDAGAHTLLLSSIFTWFEGDFTKEGTLVDFVAPYVDDDVRAAITARAPKVAFLDYDWSLNGR